MPNELANLEKQLQEEIRFIRWAKSDSGSEIVSSTLFEKAEKLVAEINEIKKANKIPVVNWTLGNCLSKIKEDT